MELLTNSSSIASNPISFTTFSDSKEDLGNISNYNEFLEKLKQGFEGVYKVLKTGKYCIVVVMDIRKKKMKSKQMPKLRFY